MRQREKIQLRHRAIQVSRYVGIYVLIFLAARLIWGWEASSRLATAQNELRAMVIEIGRKMAAAGKPTVVPNQATALVDTASKLRLSQAEADTLGESMFRLVSEGGLPAAHVALDRNRPVIDAVDEIEKLPAPAEFRDPSILTPCRQLADLICADAWVAHLEHDDLKAMNRVSQAAFIADVMSGYPGFLGILEGGVIRRRACEVLEQMGSSLRIENSEEAIKKAEYVVEAFRAPIYSKDRRSEAACLLVVEDIGGYIARWHRDYGNWWIRPIVDDQLRSDIASGVWFVGASKLDDWQNLNASVPPARLDGRDSYLNRAIVISGLSLNGNLLGGSSILQTDCWRRAFCWRPMSSTKRAFSGDGQRADAGSAPGGRMWTYTANHAASLQAGYRWADGLGVEAW